MATRKKAPKRVEVPRRSADEVTEDDCNAATTILEQDYYNDVRAVAKEVAQRLKDEQPDEANEVISEAVDGTRRVIYTWQAKLGVIISKNGDYYFEEFGVEGAVGDNGINWSQLCFVAMEQDVIEELDARGVRLGDPRSWADIDMSEFD